MKKELNIALEKMKEQLKDSIYKQYADKHGVKSLFGNDNEYISFKKYFGENILEGRALYATLNKNLCDLTKDELQMFRYLKNDLADIYDRLIKNTIKESV